MSFIGWFISGLRDHGVALIVADNRDAARPLRDPFVFREFTHHRLAREFAEKQEG